MTTENNIQTLGNYLLNIGYWLNCCDPAEAYIHEHLPNLPEVTEPIEPHLSHIIDNWCVKGWTALEVAEELGLDAEVLEPLPVNTCLATQDEHGVKTYQFKKVSPEWFMPMNQEEVEVAVQS